MSGEHIGQALIDFTSDRIFASLSDTMTPLVDGFHVLIALKPDDKGNDVVIAPGFNFRELIQIEKASIEYFVLPYGSPADKPGVSRFGNILTEMRSGLFGAKDFNRFDQNGEIESINIAYAPVTVTSLRPLNSTDLSRGTEKYRSQIFSLALAEKVKGLQDSVKGVGFALEKTSQVCLLVLCILIATGVLSVILLSSRVTFSIITPIAYLLALTRSINNLDDDWAHFGVFRGPIEVYHVHHMLRQLYLLVGFANRAFYSGDISKAIENFTEALTLFTKLGNTKAMGITSNNLGNTMLTIYRTMVKTGSPTICGLTKSDVLEKGRSYFDNAIKFGEQALAEEHEKQGWSTNYLIFLQQLSNRYFNRGMFLLTSKNEHDHPDEAEQQGLSDLGIAKDMDREVVDDGERYGFKGDSDLHFDLLMGRIMGILQLLQLGYDDFWGIEELFSEALDAINHSISEPLEESLFRAISPPGQMQRLDGALISYFLSEKFKNKRLAAQIAIRMLQEDQYVIRDAAILAINALIEFSIELTPKDLDGGDQSNLRSELFQYRRRISEASFIAKYNGKNGFLRERFKQCNQGDFFMEIF
jgi:tetratricopeptide (TPR) repeat protein